MKYVSIAFLSLLVAACGSQQRPMDEPDFSAEPYTAPEDQPRQGEVDSLISQAKLEIKRRDYDEARVKLFQVFRRDRWNPEANTLYQDLQISRGMGDALYQEYLDLYEANKTRGDALWFHLRPLLIKRGIRVCEAEQHPDAVDVKDDLEAVQEALRNWKKGTVTDAEIELLLRLKPGDPEIHLLRIQRFMEAGRQKEAVAMYQAYSEENPQSGDAQYLYAMALWGSSGNAGVTTDPMDVMRKAWILELPGVYLRSGFADLALADWKRKRIVNGTPPVQWTFEAGISLLNVALNFYRIAALSAPATDFSAKIEEVQESAANNKAVLEDLSQRK